MAVELIAPYSVLSMFVPTAFFAALDRGSLSTTNGTQQPTESGLPPSFVPLVSDFVRRDLLRMSRGISVTLLVMYVMPQVFTFLNLTHLTVTPTDTLHRGYINTCFLARAPERIT